MKSGKMESQVVTDVKKLELSPEALRVAEEILKQMDIPVIRCSDKVIVFRSKE